MQINHQALAQQLQKKIAPLYLLIGQDIYLIDDALTTIKSSIKKTAEYDERILNIQAPEDWNTLSEEANSYSLFTENVLLNVYTDKKSIDAAGKKMLLEYLKNVNSRCCIIIRAPNVPAKQVLWLSSLDQTIMVISYPLRADAMKNWISTQLKKNAITFTPQVPDLIHHYTQGNMLACAQVIEKIALSNQATILIDTKQALEHLSDQCEHSLYELVDACLLGQSDKAVQILRQSANNKTEPTLVLWMLTQEVRVHLQLNHLNQQRIDFKTATSQLKIWPQRTNLYQLSSKRLSNQVLQALLHYCQSIDEQIKSSLNVFVWNSLENLALSLCLGQLVGDACVI